MAYNPADSGHVRADDARRRWLVVGDSSGPRQVHEVLSDEGSRIEVVTAPTFLAALGELGHGPADVVVGPASLLREAEDEGSGGATMTDRKMADATVRALRELAPHARLLLLNDADDAEAPEAVAGFDRQITLPVTRSKLEAAAGPSRDASHSSPPAGDFHIGTGGEDELGDIDLIACILGGTSVRDTTLRLVRERSGIADVSMAAREEDVPATHVRARVALRGRDFGVLHAPQAESADAASANAQDAPQQVAEVLGRWAGWLAHWLALDEQVSQLKDLSMRDPLTGVWNRRYFDRFLQRILDWAGRERSQVTLLVFDIDDFKTYNDRYGHAAGDDILRECSRLMLSVVREHDVVARIGGDEFAVIFWDADPQQAPRHPGSRHPEDVVSAATRFQQAICSHQFPKLMDEAPGTLTISGGLASFPWDGRTPAELLAKADEMAMHSKRQGKNAIKFGPGAERMCQPTPFFKP